MPRFFGAFLFSAGAIMEECAEESGHGGLERPRYRDILFILRKPR
jgi:hypothetical protein